MLHVIKHKNHFRDQIESLRHAIHESKVLTPQYESRFVLLCGANRDANRVSARRRALIDFANKTLPHSQFFLAEKVFPILVKEGKRGNILDLEHKMSLFSDNIIIILESESTFAELGAFSSDTLRDKLIVINDLKFIHSNSFINLGPIKAIEEAQGKKSILYYKMQENGVVQVDSIGDVFGPLHALLNKRIRKKKLPLKLSDCHPGEQFNKRSVMIVHDLVYFIGPLMHREIIEILFIIFGRKSFLLTEHMALLTAINSVKRSSDGLYRSLLRQPYYQYQIGTYNLMSMSRNYMAKYHRDRLYGN